MTPALSDKIKLKFWGVRGSIPTPGPRTIKYGGNTPCTEITFPEKSIFVIDAGTGIRELGYYLDAHVRPEQISLFITHFHWDHIQGLPFFSSLRDKNATITIFGCEEPDQQIRHILSNQMDSTYFPIELSDLAANIQFKSLQQGKYLVNKIEVETLYINHPGYALAYRYTYGDKSIVFISDNEPFQDESNYFEQDSVEVVIPEEVTPDKIEEYFDKVTGQRTKNLIEFIKGADIFVHDAQYTPQEYKERKNWGHSPYTYALNLAIAANVKKCILFHHDPQHEDDFLDELNLKARKYASEKTRKLEVFLAREGDEYYL